MSLLKQLWLITLVPGALALAGTLTILLSPNKSHLAPSALVDHAHTTMTPRAVSVPEWFIELTSPMLITSTVLAEHESGAHAGLKLADSRPSHQTLWQGATRLALLFAATLLLKLALAWWVARHIRRSLARLQAQANDLGQRRFTTTRLPQTRELRQPTQALNRLSERLRADNLAQMRQAPSRRHSDTNAATALNVHLSEAARREPAFFNRLQGYLQTHGIPLLALDSQAAEDGLQALTLPFVKLDGALLADVQGQPRHRELLHNIVALCHAEEVLVIAQGGSSSRARAALLGLGIDGIGGMVAAPCEALRLSA